MSRYSAAVLADGPIAYFPLDDAGSTVLDAAAHGYVGSCEAGIVVGSMPFAGSGPGKFVPAPDPGGATFQTPPAILITGTLAWPLSALPHHPAAFTYEFWMRVTVPNVRLGFFCPMQVTDGDSGGALNLGTYALRIAGGALRLESVGPGTIGLADSGMGFDNLWHHAAFTWDGSTALWYWNCTPVVTDNAMASAGFTPSAAQIGGFRTQGEATSEYAHLALYEYALSGAQIAAHCAAARPPRVRLTVAPGAGAVRLMVRPGSTERLTVSG